MTPAVDPAPIKAARFWLIFGDKKREGFPPPSLNPNLQAINNFAVYGTSDSRQCGLMLGLCWGIVGSTDTRRKDQIITSFNGGQG